MPARPFSVTPEEMYGVLVLAIVRLRPHAWIWSVPAAPSTMKVSRDSCSQARTAPDGVYLSSRITTSTPRPKIFLFFQYFSAPFLNDACGSGDAPDSGAWMPILM